MPAVFVHGNPETDAIWGPLVSELGRSDVVLLSPPGFGAPVPDGWGATRQEYADWLADELAGIDGPIDLVGHDWGGGHVLAVVVAQPELVRSWCSDVLGLLHPDYVWHDMAQVWRTPGAGEESVKGMVDAPLADRAALYEALGMTHDVAEAVARGADETMARCILDLYRSAPEADLQKLAADLPNASARPGLAIIATEDQYLGPGARAAEMAERAGAQVASLEGLGHWWMVQDPAAGAAALTEFWSSLD